MTVRIIPGDCREVLRGLPADSAHCCVTSPPYYGLRDYGLEPQVWGGDAACSHDWEEQRWYTEQSAAKATGSGEAFSKPGPANAQRLKDARWRTAASCKKCSAWRGSLGLEPSPQMFVAHMVEIFREVHRVLRPDGTAWVNLGDSYANDSKWGGRTGGKHAGALHEDAIGRGRRNTGLKSKDLIGIPWRVAFALQADGWYLRQDIIWSKPNPMPESVQDRCTKAHEYLFLLSKSERYYFDGDAIAEGLAPASIERLSQPNLAAQQGSARVPGKSNGRMKAVGKLVGANGPDRPSKGVPNEAAPRVRGTPPRHAQYESSDQSGLDDVGRGGKRNKRSVWTVATQPFREAHFATFPPALIEPCILAGSPTGGVVLDPFGGAGTTGMVADRLGRDGLLIELNPAYAALAADRLRQDGGMFSGVHVA